MYEYKSVAFNEEEFLPEVADGWRIVTIWGRYRQDDMVLLERPLKFEYQTVNTTLFSNVEEAANEYASMGWRVVAGLGSQGPGYADVIIIERPIRKESNEQYQQDRQEPSGIQDRHQRPRS